MIRRIQQNIFSKISSYPNLKKSILRIWDAYHYVLPFVIGFFTRVFVYPFYRFNSIVLAKPGTLVFKGGVFNPGALIINEKEILLIAKSQLLPWYKAIGENRKYYLQGSPIILILEQISLKIRQSYIISHLIGYPNEDDCEIEDLRLFTWKDKKMINHSLIEKYRPDGYLKIKSVSSALSVLENENRILRFCGVPKLDFCTKEFEKNWVYKEHQKKLLLFYSVNPYKVLTLDNEEDFSFKTILNINNHDYLSDPGGFGTMVSFSTNPIDFDEKHWFMVIHQIEYKITGRCYYHWGLLIDKSTFLPVKITSKPIFSGMNARGRLPGIRYISSVLKVKNELLFFAGEGDIFVTVTKKKINDLSSLFIQI